MGFEEGGMADHIDQLERAVGYIEANLDAAFDLSAVAREAGMSSFHFSRVFRSVTGAPASEYARKRRLTRAADRLIGGSEAIVDIALSSGFESQEAFTRAFGRWYGVSPARFRRRAMPYMLKDTPPLTRLALESLSSGEVSMEARFEERDDSAFIGVACENSASRIGIPKAWVGFLRRMREVVGPASRATYGVYDYDYAAPAGSIGEDFPFRYLAGVEVEGGGASRAPEGMESWSVAAASYAVFAHRGLLRDLGRSYRYIYKTWFPRQSLDFAAAPFFERRAADYPGDRPDAVTELWIPIAR
jgi:AraC family transcriptional regulator